MRNKIYTQNGFTLLEMMVGIGIISIATLVVAGMSYSASQTNKTLAEQTSALSFRNALLTMIENPTAWRMTVPKNNEMACLKVGGDCSGATGGTFDVFDHQGSLFYAGDSNPEAGFTASGTICSGYPSAACGFRYNLTWSPICPIGVACTNPLVLINGALERAEAASTKLNLTELSFSTFRRFDTNTVERNCFAIGGTLDPRTQKCVSKLQAQHCPSGQIVVGMKIGGQILCSPPFKGHCEGGTVLAGFNRTTGEPVCQSKPVRFPADYPVDPLPENNSCQTVGRVNGDHWWVPNGLAYEPAPCTDADGRSGQRFQIFEQNLELVCNSGAIAPTGETNRVDTGRYQGACMARTCSGRADGDIYFSSLGQSQENVRCPTSKVITSLATYNLEAQYQCINGFEIMTGTTRKVVLSETPCPPMTFTDQTTSTTVAYEDIYPSNGDTDFNDVVLGMDVYERYNSIEELVSITMSFKSIAPGGGINTASVIVFDGHVRGKTPELAGFANWVSNVNGFVSDAMFDGVANIKYELIDSNNNVLVSRENVAKDADLVFFPDNKRAYRDKLTAKITIVGINPIENFLLKREKLSILRYRVLARILNASGYSTLPRYDLDLSDINPTMFSAANLPMAFFVPTDWCPPKETHSIQEMYPNFMDHANWLHSWQQRGRPVNEVEPQVTREWYRNLSQPHLVTCN